MPLRNYLRFDPTVHDHCGDPRCVVNIIERIGAEQYEIGYLISLDGADGIEFAKKLRSVSGCGLERLHWGAARTDQRCEFVLDRAVSGFGRQVRASKESHTGPLHHFDDFRIPGKQAVSPAKVIGRVFGGVVGP